MIVVTTVQTRPSVVVPFYMETEPELEQTIIGLITNSVNMAEAPQFFRSADGLVHTAIAKYADADQLGRFMAEFTSAVPSFFTMRDVYNARNGISTQRLVEEA